MEINNDKVGTILSVNNDKVEIRIATKGCAYCYFNNQCINPPKLKVMPCFSNDRKLIDGQSVYYHKL